MMLIVSSCSQVGKIPQGSHSGSVRKSVDHRGSRDCLLLRQKLIRAGNQIQREEEKVQEAKLKSLELVLSTLNVEGKSGKHWLEEQIRKPRKRETFTVNLLLKLKWWYISKPLMCS